MPEKTDFDDLDIDERRKRADEKVRDFARAKAEREGARTEEDYQGPRLMRESEWRRLRKPPEWLIYNVLERGYAYSLTAPYGSGKTIVSLLIAYLIGAPNMFPRLFGSLEVERGAVAIFAGENPTDVIRKAEGLRIHYGLGEVEADVFMVPGRFSIKDSAEKLAAQVPKDKPLSLVIVDTSAAFFEGDEENSNSDMAAHARTLRKLCRLPGDPAMLAACHPKLNAPTRQEMVPRGGSAFTGELDGNLILWELSNRLFEFSNAGKPLRSSSGFDPLTIESVSMSDPIFNDAKGRPSSVGVARIVTEQEADDRAEAGVSSETKILEAVSFAMPTGLRNKQIEAMHSMPRSTVSDVLQKLARKGQVEKIGARWILKESGRTKTRTKADKRREKDD